MWRVWLRANPELQGLPDFIDVTPGRFTATLDMLVAREPGDFDVTLLDEGGAVLTGGNPLRVYRHTALLPFWADLHGHLCIFSAAAMVTHSR